MTVFAITHHSDKFDIFTKVPDPNLSDYNLDIPTYAAKVLELYRQLGIHSAIWAYPEYSPPECMQVSKPIEYILEVDSSRVIAYVDSRTWSDWLHHDKPGYKFSITDADKKMGSMLIRTPLLVDEVRIWRQYKIYGPENFELINEVRYSIQG